MQDGIGITILKIVSFYSFLVINLTNVYGVPMLNLALFRHWRYICVMESFPFLLTFSIHLKFIFKYGERRSCKMVLFLHQEAGAWWNSSVMVLPPIGSKG